jgi:type II secretory pathway component PulM
LRNPQRFYHQPDGYNHLVGRLGDALHVHVAQHLVAYQPYALSPREDRVFAGLVALAALLLATLGIWVVPAVQRATRFAAEGPPER